MVPFCTFFGGVSLTRGQRRIPGPERKEPQDPDLKAGMVHAARRQTGPMARASLDQLADLQDAILGAGGPGGGVKASLRVSPRNGSIPTAMSPTRPVLKQSLGCSFHPNLWTFPSLKGSVVAVSARNQECPLRIGDRPLGGPQSKL